MIAIFVDADACPVKDEVYSVSTRYELEVALVANQSMNYPAGCGITMILVEEGLDAADDWIAENVQPGDIVVTADLPLAARCIEAGAYAIGTSGREFTEDSIGGLLATRDLKAHLRESGQVSGGPPPISAKDRSRFLSTLDELVNRSLREQQQGA